MYVEETFKKCMLKISKFIKLFPANFTYTFWLKEMDKQSKAGLNFEFSFLTGCFTKVKEL